MDTGSPDRNDQASGLRPQTRTEEEHNMRRSLISITAGLLLALAAALPAAASDMCASGRDFGAHHSAMAQNGELGRDMNPGMHRGFSVCFP
jgi:hypothetical protein